MSSPHCESCERLKAEIVENAKWGHEHEMHGASKERARVIAALRFEAEAAGKMPGEVWAGVAAAMTGAANYIERCEHLQPGKP